LQIQSIIIIHNDYVLSMNAELIVMGLLGGLSGCIVASAGRDLTSIPTLVGVGTCVVGAVLVVIGVLFS
jgi:ethanolamine utilization protein EutA (predicted chaperonin)